MSEKFRFNDSIITSIKMSFHGKKSSGHVTNIQES